MTEQHDSMAYKEGEAKRTNPIRDGGVVIGTMPTKYLQFFTALQHNTQGDMR